MKFNFKEFTKFIITKRIGVFPIALLLLIPFVVFIFSKDIANLVIQIFIVLIILYQYFLGFENAKKGQNFGKLVIQNLWDRKYFLLTYIIFFVVMFLLPQGRSIFLLIVTLILTIVGILFIDRFRYLKSKIVYENRDKVVGR